MKFKKSNILLISLISLLLLLSISAASAASDADMIAQDSAIDDIIELGDIDSNARDVEVLSQGEDTFISDEAPETGDDGGEGGEDPVDDSIDTSIEANDTEYVYGDTIKINFSLMDNESNPINNTNESNFKVFYKNVTEEDFNHTLGFSINNESQLVLDRLGVGNYSLKIQFLNSTIGDKNYTESYKIIDLNITQTNTTFNASVAKVKIGEDIIIPFRIYIESNKTLNVNASRLNVTCNGIEYSFTNITGGDNVTNGIKLSNFTIDGVNEYEIFIQYLGNENCNPSNITIILRILENNTIHTNDTIKVNDSNKTVTIPFIVSNTNITNITDEETGESVPYVNVTNLNLTAEDLYLILSYFNSTSNETEEISINGFVLENTTEEGGNYTLSFNLDDINFSTDFYKANLTIIYKNGTQSETNKTISLVAFAEVTLVPINDTADYQFGQFAFQLLYGGQPIANQNVTLTGFYFYSVSEKGTSLSTSKTFTTDENGMIIFNDTLMSVGVDVVALYYNFTSLPAGTYNATFATSGFYKLNNKTEITVNPIQAKIVNAKNITGEYGNILKYTFQLVHAVTGEPIKLASVQFIINASNINAFRDGYTNLTGWYTSPDLNLTGGNYNLTLKSTEKSLNCSAVKAKLTVTARKATLTAYNRTIYYNSDYTTVLRLNDKKTGKVVANAYVWLRVYLNSSKYTDFIAKTNKNGQVYLTTPLDVGKHKIIYQTIDNNYNASKITRYITVKTASAKFTAPKVTTYYKSGRVFKIKLTNTNTKKAIHTAKMNIKLFISKNKYYNYTGVTDGNGLVQIKATLNPGTYKVVVSDYDKGYVAKAVTSQIKVTKSPIKIAPTALKVKRGSYFKVKVTSTKTNKVLSAVNVKVKVYTGKKYKIYTIKTNKNGIASLKISQSVGKHKIVLSPAQTKFYSAVAITRTLTVTK